MAANVRVFLLCLLAAIVSFCVTDLASAGTDYTIGKPNDTQATLNSVVGHKGNNAKLIFIPGILGSKLLRSGVDAAKKDYVWGGLVTNDPDLVFDGRTTLKATFFDQVDVPVLGKLFDTDVYGKALLMLQDSQDLGESDVLKFAYDWRQSNVLSAKDLNKWLCDNRNSLQGNQVVFLAHSMGGLVLKNWFLDYYDKGAICGAGDSDWLQIRRVYFAGTPHFGAAKALAALFGQYSLFDTWFPKTFLGDGVKAFGYSFDSFYELLPVQNDPECDFDRSAAGLASALVLDGGAKNYPNVFDIEFMEKNDLPRADGIDRAKFRNDRLRGKLANIASRACELAKYQFPKLGLSKVVVFAGQNPAGNKTLNTTLQVHLTSTGSDLINGEGDGTVSKASAIWLPELGDTTHVDFVSSLHMKIPADQDLKSKLQTEVHSVPLQSALLLKQRDPDHYQDAIKELAKRHQLFFPAVDDANLAKEAQAINSDIFAANGTTDSEIASAATSARAISGGQSQISYTLNEYVASHSDFSTVDKFFAANTVARELQKMGYESLSKPLYDQFLPNSLDLLQNTPSTYSPKLLNQLESTTGNAFNTLGTILEHQGDLNGAKQDYLKGIEFNNLKAQHNFDRLNAQ